MLLLAALLGICLASIVATWGARSLGVPGGRIVPGVLVAILLGPAVLGRIAPEQWTHVFAGGVQERTQLRQLDRAHAAWSLAAESAPGAGELRLAENARHQEERAPLVAALAMAESRHQRPWVILTTILAWLAIVSSTACGARVRRESHPGNTAAISVGAWSAVVPILGVLLMARGLGENPLQAEILLVAAAVSIGPWSFEARELLIISRIEGAPRWWPLTAARTATLCAAALVAWAGIQDTLAWFMVVPALLGMVRFPVSRTLRRWMRRARNNLILPALAAMTIFMSDIFIDAGFWSIVGVAILCSDGRWLGAALGLHLGGQRLASAAMRGAIVAIDAAGPQIALCAMAAALGLLDGEWITSLVLGACLIELAAPLRGMLEQHLRSQEA